MRRVIYPRREADVSATTTSLLEQRKEDLQMNAASSQRDPASAAAERPAAAETEADLERQRCALSSGPGARATAV